MKKFMKSFALLAVAALGLSACNDDKLVPDNGNADGKFVTVHFGAEASIEGATKATLTTEDEKTFKSAWENGDVLSVKYSNDNETAGATTSGVVSATWTTDHFDATLPKYKGMWDYNVVYPAPDAESKVDFGSARTQKGNAYNSKYDLMKGSAIVENADEGKTDAGKNIVFNMTRQTAIAYFHLTSTLDEEVVSAKLSVEGGNIASSLVKLLDHTDGFDLSTEDLNEITITFEEGTAPKASNFQLWYNVLPTKYTKMTLTVETATKTFTISKNTAGEYVAGKLYKVSKAIANEKWESKYSVKCRLISDAATLNDGDKITFVNQANSIVAASTITNNYFKAISGVTFNTDKSLAYMPESDYLVVTIKSNGEGWLFENAEGKYLKLTTTKTGLSFDDEGTTWTISIDNSSAATISGQYNTTSTSLQWNTGANPMRLSNYTSTQSAVYIYVVDDPRTALDTPENLSISNMTLSWNAVPNAKEYKVTIGSEVATVSETSYTLSLEADYYNVSVIAVAEEGSAFKNSVAATLTDAKFGTPTLATPTLKEGAVDEFSVNTTWTVDSRATAGYNCELYKGETKVGDGQTVSTGSVTFDGLDDGVTYTVKVNAIAVEGTKAYAASAVKTIDLTTTPASKVSDVTEATTYTIKNLTVYAVPNTSLAILGDATGYILFYKNNHGLSVGNTLDVAGPVVDYYGLWEFKGATASYVKTGPTPDYGEPVEATNEFLASFATKPLIKYIHAIGEQSGQDITVGENKLHLSAENSSTDGKTVIVYGFTYGYHSKNQYVQFVATSIAEDPTAPKLSVKPTSKTWESDEKDAAVFTVTTNAEGVNGWSVTHDPIDWATVAIDKDAGTIIVTPKDANTAKTANEAKLTVKHAAGTLSETITLTQKAAGSTITYESYSTGFESDEGFTAGTNYQSTVTVGAEGKQWKIFYGTPSTSSKITGSQSLAMRLYTSNNYGYAEMQFDVPGATKVSFKAKAATSNSAAIKLTIKESTDGGTTWTTVNNWSAHSLNHTADDYSFTVSGNPEKYRIRFEIDSSSTKPKKSNAQLTIDDVTISVD